MSAKKSEKKKVWEVLNGGVSMKWTFSLLWYIYCIFVEFAIIFLIISKTIMQSNYKCRNDSFLTYWLPKGFDKIFLIVRHMISFI